LKVALIGRTRVLLETAELILKQGHTIPLVWTCKAEPYYGVNEGDFKELANRIGALYVSNVQINKPQNVDLIRHVSCDVALSVNWPTLVSQAVIDCFSYGVLNAHAGDLPRYRGNAPLNWAILNGEETVGLCIHKMVPELDAGPMLVRTRKPLTRDTYISDLYDWLYDRAPTMFLEAVNGLAAGTIEETLQPSDPQKALRCYPRRPEDGRIDWSRSVEHVYRLIRASSRPFTGAFSAIEGERRVTIWRAQPEQSLGAFLAIPGQVCGRVDGDPIVACGDGMIRLLEIEITGISDQTEAKRLLHRSLRTRLRS